MKNIIRYLNGYLRIAVEGVYVERFLNMCCHHHIDLWNIKPGNSYYEMNISVSGFRKLKSIIKKTNTNVSIKKRYGFPFLAHKYRNRQCFLLCALLCTFLLYISTFFVWNIQIEGEEFYTEEQLKEELRKINVYPGKEKAKINCTGIAGYLRENYDKITWASVYLKGTYLKINIKESSDMIEVAETDEKPQNLISDCDGEIISIITRKGVPQIHAGDVVETGDVLVSGEIGIKNDAGEITEYQYVSPDATILASISMDYIDKLPLAYEEKVFTGRSMGTFWISAKEQMLSCDLFHPPYENYVVATEESLLFQGVRVGKKTWKEYQITKGIYTPDEYQEILSDRFHRFCEELEKKGVQILENSVKIYTESEQVYAKGSLTICKEIGIRQEIEKKEIEKKEVQEGKIYGNP